MNPSIEQEIAAIRERRREALSYHSRRGFSICEDNKLISDDIPRLLAILDEREREVEKLVRAARELMNSRTCTTSYKEYGAVEKLCAALEHFKEVK